MDNIIVSKEDIIPLLVKFYNNDLQHLIDNYKTLETLDSALFKELSIDFDSLRRSLQNKIKNLKSFYWYELSDRLDSIRNRLTTKYRKTIFDTVRASEFVDFTESNIYNIVVWIVKNANKYFDKQLLDIFNDFCNEKNIKLYKSNKHLVDGSWRYSKGSKEKVYLDYRIVLTGWGAITTSTWEGRNGLYDYAIDKIDDIMTVAYNLGFKVNERALSFQWKSGRKNVFTYAVGGIYKVFAEIKAFKNGNLHIKFCQEFIKALNIEAGRLKGWLKNYKDAVDELDELDEIQAKKYFKTNFIYNDMKALPYFK